MVLLFLRLWWWYGGLLMVVLRRLGMAHMLIRRVLPVLRVCLVGLVSLMRLVGLPQILVWDGTLRMLNDLVFSTFNVVLFFLQVVIFNLYYHGLEQI